MISDHGNALEEGEEVGETGRALMEEGEEEMRMRCACAQLEAAGREAASV